MKLKKMSAFIMAVMMAAGCAGTAFAGEAETVSTESVVLEEETSVETEAASEETPADDEIVSRVYTLENAMDTTISELYVYQSKGENLVPDGLEPGEQVTAEVFGYYLHTPNETLHTVEFVADGKTYSFETLHVEDLFEVLYLTGAADDTADAASGATVVAFEKPEN